DHSSACSLIPLPLSCSHCYAVHRDLHSFPTRRSSDLAPAGFHRGDGLAAGVQLHRAGRQLHASTVGLLQQVLQVGRDDLHHPLRSEEHTSELQSRENLVCRLLLEKKNKQQRTLRTKCT